jgi:hypothetical protein
MDLYIICVLFFYLCIIIIIIIICKLWCELCYEL